MRQRKPPPLTICAAGHPLTNDNKNWLFNGRGEPYVACRECNRIRARAWRKKNAARLDGNRLRHPTLAPYPERPRP